MAAVAVLPDRSAENIAQRTVCVKFSTGKIGNSKKVKTSQIEVDADKDLLRVSKTLFDSDEYRAIKNLDHEVRAYLKKKALPFDVGVNLVPLEMVEALDAKLCEFRDQRRELVEKFLAVYPDLCAAAEPALRALHNPMDYPDVEYVRAQFTMTWQYVSYGVPGQLAELSKKIWSEERNKMRGVMEDAAEEIRQCLRSAMLELVANMRDRLDTPEGKPKVFAPICRNLAEFMADFDFRNVADDDALAALVNQARRMLSGVTPADLKDGVELRTKVREGMAGIADKLSKMVIDKPTRRIRLEEE